jgi:hypothetical protein
MFSDERQLEFVGTDDGTHKQLTGYPSSPLNRNLVQLNARRWPRNAPEREVVSESRASRTYRLRAAILWRAATRA